MHTITLQRVDLLPLILPPDSADATSLESRMQYVWEVNNKMTGLLAHAHEAFQRTIKRALLTAQKKRIGLDEIEVRLPVPNDLLLWKFYCGDADKKILGRFPHHQSFNLEQLRAYLDSRQPKGTLMHRLRLRHSRDFRTLIMSFPLRPTTVRQRRRTHQPP